MRRQTKHGKRLQACSYKEEGRASQIFLKEIQPEVCLLISSVPRQRPGNRTMTSIQPLKPISRVGSQLEHLPVLPEPTTAQPILILLWSSCRHYQDGSKILFQPLSRTEKRNNSTLLDLLLGGDPPMGIYLLQFATVDPHKFREAT